jgi:hypothetical protein
MKYKLKSNRNDFLNGQIVEIMDIKSDLYVFVDGLIFSKEKSDKLVKIIETGELYIIPDEYILEILD